MNKYPDLHYLEEGLFVTYFPNTEEGKEAWLDMIKLSPGGKCFAIHRKQINSQLKAAGYSVRKAPPVRLTEGEIAALLCK